MHGNLFKSDELLFSVMPILVNTFHIVCFNYFKVMYEAGYFGHCCYSLPYIVLYIIIRRIIIIPSLY